MLCLLAASVHLHYAYSADQIYRNTPRLYAAHCSIVRA